jgi:hypothetical protein
MGVAFSLPILRGPTLRQKKRPSPPFCVVVRKYSMQRGQNEKKKTIVNRSHYLFNILPKTVEG